MSTSTIKLTTVTITKTNVEANITNGNKKFKEEIHLEMELLKKTIVVKVTMYTKKVND